MQDLSEERVKVLAEKNGWSLRRAEGYLDGENSRRLGIQPSSYVQVGIDDYCAGFRTAYYEREDAASKPRGILAARL